MDTCTLYEWLCLGSGRVGTLIHLPYILYKRHRDSQLSSLLPQWSAHCYQLPLHFPASLAASVAWTKSSAMKCMQK